MSEKNTTYSTQVIEIADFIFKYPDRKMSDVLSYFVKKCHKTERTVNRYIKKAKEYNKTRIWKQEKIRDRALADETKKAVKSDIISRNESLEILSRKAKGTAREIPTESQMIDGEKVYTKWTIEYPSDSDQIKAIQQLAKMEGWEAPVKTESTIVEKNENDFNIDDIPQNLILSIADDLMRTRSEILRKQKAE